MDVLSNLGSYFSQFNIPLTVSVISKLTKWPNLQSLGHDAMLTDLSQNFHGIKDAKVQFATHAAANPAQLAQAYAAIQPMILLNAETAKLLSDDPVLGPVGPAVSSIGNLGAVFSISASSLTGGTAAISKLVT